MINIEKEFNSFIQFILNTWTFQNQESFIKAAKIAFDIGTLNAKLFCDQGICFDINNEIIKTTPNLSIETRQKSKFSDNSPALIFDAFSFFDYNLSKKINDFSKSQFDKYPYDKHVSLLIKKIISDFPELNHLQPTLNTHENTKELVEKYSGFTADNIYYQNTLYRVSPEEVIYSHSEQGNSFSHIFFSVLYSHGLACQQEYNTQKIKKLLIPFYIKFLELPLSQDNHDDILANFPKNEILDLFIQDKLTYKI